MLVTADVICAERGESFNEKTGATRYFADFRVKLAENDELVSYLCVPIDCFDAVRAGKKYRVTITDCEDT